MAILLLTSTGISSEAVRTAFVREMGTRRDQRIAIITNAASNGREDKYTRLAEQQFSDLGFSMIFFVDVTTDSLSLLQSADIIYVVGGNTFTLLREVQSSGADRILFKRLTTDPHLLYIGVSAGSMILTPTIRLANEVERDSNDGKLTDFSGLSIFPEEIYAHYTENVEAELREYETRHSVTVRRITNEEALLVKDGETRLVS